MKGCSVDGCDRRFYARGLCQMHYKRVWRGSPLNPEMPARSQARTEDRFWAKVRKTPTCWMWTGRPTSAGYGALRVDGRMVPAHRVAYELLVAPIPDGLHIDHLCRVRTCVNPEHLEPVTNQENVLRGVGPSALNAVKTHCIHGHEFTPENTFPMKDGRRACRECGRIRSRQYRARKKEATG